jgi:hypothetical protein
LKKKTLIRSHLAPAALYELCRTPESEPVIVTPNVVMQSSRQWQDYLLCGKCDNLFSQEGENWVLPLLAKPDGSFPFYDILVKGAPEGVVGDSALYAAAKNPDIDAAKLTHFAMGIFWKASVHSWSGERTDTLVDLGEYGEGVRRFLRAEGCFPEHMALIVGVSPPPLMPTFNKPYRGSAKAFHNFLFHVPGINFALHAGNLVSREMKQTCFASHPLHPVFLTDLSGENLEIAKGAAAGAHKARNLLKYVNESEELAEYREKRKSE